MIYLLLVTYQLKHFLCDYPLQGRYMLRKFDVFPKFILPLLAHALVHGVFTFLISLAFRQWRVALMFGLFDAATHFGIDRIKASPYMLGRFQALSKSDFVENQNNVTQLQNRIKELSVSAETIHLVPGLEAEIVQTKADFAARMKANTFFWWSLGADQMAHHLVHYAIIWRLLS